MSYLQEAFREAARREFAMIPDEEDIEYAFSPKFLRKMRGLLRAEAYGYWKYVNTTAKRVAIAVAIIVMLLTSAMAIKPIRERVIKFFLEVYEEYFEITFGEEDSGDLYSVAKSMTRYTLSWVPDGYKEDGFLETDVLINTIWKNENGSIISLFQTPGTHTITMDHINSSLSDLNHATLSISYQTNNGAIELIWEQYGYIFQLTIHDSVSTEEIIKIVDSLKCTDK